MGDIIGGEIVYTEALPSPRVRCGRRNKMCRECGYRYVAGDKSFICPECGEDRRCRNAILDGYKTCRMHGAKGGPPVTSTKYHVARDIHKAYNRIINSPERGTLYQEIGIVSARIDELLRMIDANSFNGNSAQEVERARARIEMGVITGNKRHVAQGLTELKVLLSPTALKHQIYAEIRDNLFLLQKLMDSQHRWDQDNEQLVHVGQLYEVISYFQRKFFKYLRDPQDRRAFINELRADLLPRRELIAASNVSDKNP